MIGRKRHQDAAAAENPPAAKPDNTKESVHMTDSSAPRSRRKADERSLVQGSLADYGGVSQRFICNVIADAMEAAMAADMEKLDSVAVWAARDLKDKREGTATILATAARLLTVQADPKTVVQVLREVK